MLLHEPGKICGAVESKVSRNIFDCRSRLRQKQTRLVHSAFRKDVRSGFATALPANARQMSWRDLKVFGIGAHGLVRAEFPGHTL